MGSIFFTGAVHRPQIGKIRPPDRQCILRAAPGAGKVGRFNQLPIVGQHLTGGGQHRFPNPIHIFLASSCLQIVLLGDPALTAGGLGTHTAVRMLSPGSQGLSCIGSGHHTLCPQCFRFKICRHFRQHHPHQIGIHVPFRHCSFRTADLDHQRNRLPHLLLG